MEALGGEEPRLHDARHLAMGAIERVPRMADAAGHLCRKLRDKLTDHERYIREYGEDMPEIRDWRWDG
jgi:xylulose-5-phosphate/fructose-6-phosphate phosphoketolase